MSLKDKDNGDLSIIYEPHDIMYDSDNGGDKTFVVHINDKRIKLPYSPWVSKDETVIIEIDSYDW